MNNPPHTMEEQIRKMALAGLVSRNWLMFQAHEAGLDISDKIHGYDDGEGPRGGDYQE